MTTTRLSFSLALIISLAACQHSDIPPIDTRISLPTSFEHSPDNPSKTDIRTWWQHFQDPILNRLIDDALANAPDIAIAKARMEQAQATAALADSDKNPLLGATAGAGIALGNLDNPLSNALLTPIGDSLAPAAHSRQSALIGSWTADFFGKKQSDADAAYYAYLSETERLHGAQILLAAHIARHYIEARHIEAHSRILQTQKSALQELARYAAGRFAAGQASQYDREDLATKIAALNAQIAGLDAERSNHITHIAALAGKTELHITADGGKLFASLPAAPGGHYPAELITRRPDIRARKAAVLARSAQVASAEADFYPRFSLNFALAEGRIGLDGDLLQHSLGGNGAGLGINLQLPIFTAGRLQAQLDKAEAQLRQALAEYDQTLLNALAEAQNSYRLAAALEKQAQSLNKALQHSETQIAQARSLFKYGRETFDTIPSAILNAAEYRTHQLANRRGYALNLIQLYSALGGGWEQHTP